MPLLLGLRIEEARAALEDAGLRANESAEADDSPAGMVIYQDIEPGTAVLPGATVTIVVSSGPDPEPPPESTSTTDPGSF